MGKNWFLVEMTQKELKGHYRGAGKWYTKSYGPGLYDTAFLSTEDGFAALLYCGARYEVVGINLPVRNINKAFEEVLKVKDTIK